MKLKTFLIVFFGVLILLLTGCTGDNKKVKTVVEQINGLPEVVTLEDESLINDVRAAYDNLSESDKKKVNNLTVLIEKENQLKDTKTANAVDQLIDALPEKVDYTNKVEFDEVNSAYNLLTEVQKGYLKSKEVLDQKNAQYNKSVSDKAEAISVDELILSLPDSITTEDEVLLENVIIAYDALTSEQKLLVENKELLDTKLEELVTLKDKTTAKLVDDLILALPEKVNYSHKIEIDEVNSLYNELTVIQKGYLKNKELLDQKNDQYNKSVADKEKANSVDDLILALPEVITLEDIELVNKAKSEFDVLTSEQKALVLNFNKLSNAIEYVVYLSEIESINLVNDFILEMPDKVSKENESSFDYILNKYNNLSELSKSKIKNYEDFYNNYIKIRLIVLEDWAKSHIGENILLEVDFVGLDPIYGYRLSWSSSEEFLIDDLGYTYPTNEDNPLTVYCDVEIDGEKHRININTILIAAKYSLAADDFYSQFKTPIVRDYTVVSASRMYPDATITWRSLNEEIFTNEGKLIKPGKDTLVGIEISVSFPNDPEPKTIIRNLTVKGLTMGEKADIIEAWIYENVGNNRVIFEDVEFPTYFEKYDMSLSWVSSDPNILTSDGKFTNPGYDSAVIMIVTLNSGDDMGIMEARFIVTGTRYENKWEALDMLFSYINLPEINNFEMRLYGVGRTDITQNFGYLPFFVNTRSEVIEGIVDRSLTQTRSGKLRPGTKYITIHDTANVNANAKAHNDYINSGKAVDVSWHYTVDDKEIYNHIPNDEVAWHAGNTISDLFSGNQYSIGIETSIHFGVDYNQVMRNTAKLTAELLLNYGLTIDDVKQHADFSGKDCPRSMRAANRWYEFLNLVKIEYFALLNLTGVEFVWESLSPEVMDNTGKIISHPGDSRPVGYKVKVTIDGLTKEFTFVSNIKALTFTPKI